MVKIIQCTNCKGSIEVEGFENGAKEAPQNVTCPHCEHPNEVMWPMRGIYTVEAASPREREVLTMRRVLKDNRAEVERQMREQARAMVQQFGETGPSEEELMAWFTNCVDSILHPQAGAQESPGSDDIGSVENRPIQPIPLQLSENSLKDCLDDLCKSWEGAFQQKGARLETEFEPSIQTFRFDYQKIQQAAVNLLDHAWRRALPGGTVTLRCLSQPSGAEVSLTGATEHDQKVFDKSPAPYSRPRDYQESLDLGLTIAKSLVLAHGGRIWVEPSSTGSKFVFLLPMDAS